MRGGGSPTACSGSCSIVLGGGRLAGGASACARSCARALRAPCPLTMSAFGRHRGGGVGDECGMGAYFSTRNRPGRPNRCRWRLWGARRRLEEARRCLEGPSRRLEEPRRRLQEPRRRLEEPRRRLEGPRRRLQGPRRRLQGPRRRLQGPRHRLEEPRRRLQEPRRRLQEPRRRLEEPRRCLEERRDAPQTLTAVEEDRLGEGGGSPTACSGSCSIVLGGGRVAGVASACARSCARALRAPCPLTMSAFGRHRGGGVGDGCGMGIQLVARARCARVGSSHNWTNARVRRCFGA